MSFFPRTIPRYLLSALLSSVSSCLSLLLSLVAFYCSALVCLSSALVVARACLRVRTAFDSLIDCSSIYFFSATRAFVTFVVVFCLS